MRKKNILVLLLLIVLYSCDEKQSTYQQTNKLVKFVKDNPVSLTGENDDVFLESYGSFSGTWHPTILFFGSNNDSNNCNEIVEFYKTVEPSSKFRCSPTKGYEYKLKKKKFY